MLFPVIHKFDSFEKVDFNINVHDDYKSYKNFEIWKFWNFMKTEFFWKFWNLVKILNLFENFRVFVNRRWSPSVPNKYKTFILSVRGTKNPWKRLTLPVHSLKNYGQTIVKQLEKEKNSNFNVENFVVMFIYWGTITFYIKIFKLFQRNKVMKIVN